MVSSRSLRVFNVLQELNRRRTIPASYREILEERLTITFKPLGVRLKRGKTPRSKKEYKEKSGDSNGEVEDGLPDIDVGCFLDDEPHQRSIVLVVEVTLSETPE